MNFADYIKTSSYLNTRTLDAGHFSWPVNIYRFAYVVQSQEKKMDTFMPYLHQHYFMEIHIPIQGSTTYSIMNENVELNPLDVVLISRNTNHSMPFVSDDLKKLSIGFLPVQDEDSPQLKWLKRFQKSNCYVKCRLPDWYMGCLENTVCEVKRNNGNDSLLYAVMIQLLNEIAIQTGERMMDYSDKVDFNDERIKEIECFIDDNIGLRITAQSISDHLFISSRQVDRIIMASRGITLKQLIDQKKTETAKELITNSDLPVCEIAARLGFQDSSSFIHFFKRITGYTPQALRCCNLHDSVV